MANAIDARLESLVAQIKPASHKVHRPFANDPELRRICNRLGSTGSQLAGWMGDPSRKHREQSVLRKDLQKALA